MNNSPSHPRAPANPDAEPARLGSSGRRALAVVLLLGLLGAASPGRTAEPTNAPPTLEQVQKAMSSADTVFARFVQERHLSLFKEPLRSEGYLCCQKPGRIRWETTDPYRSILVSDGSAVAQFEWIDGRWKKLEAGLAQALQSVVQQIAGVIQGRYAGDQREFAATVTTTDAGPLLTLVPQIERLQRVLERIEVHLAPDLLSTRRVVLREVAGDHTDIRFEDISANFTVPDGAFNRKQPADIEAIRAAAAASRTR